MKYALMLTLLAGCSRTLAPANIDIAKVMEHACLCHNGSSAYAASKNYDTFLVVCNDGTEVKGTISLYASLDIKCQENK